MRHPAGPKGDVLRPEVAAAVRRTLVGELPQDALVVATPIRSMFRRLRAHGWTDCAHGGWWPRLELGRAQAVLVPQGGAVADLCRALHGIARFDLLGYAGSLTAQRDVGDVVRPVSASLADSTDRFPLAGTRDGAEGVRLVTVPHLLWTYEELSRTATDVVVADMETGHAADALQRAGGPAPTAHLVITDRWPDRPFYAGAASAADRIAVSRAAAVDSLVAELHQDGTS